MPLDPTAGARGGAGDRAVFPRLGGGSDASLIPVATIGRMDPEPDTVRRVPSGWGPGSSVSAPATSFMYGSGEGGAPGEGWRDAELRSRSLASRIWGGGTAWTKR